jgi:hypothetical protein
MVPITALWLPILLGAVLVFIASSLVHMVLPFHKSDYSRVPKEDDFMAAARTFDLPPGDYLVPCAGSHRDINDPAFVDKLTKGPVLLMTVLPSGKPSMGPQLALWFVYCVVVGIFAAYVAGRALAPGAHYLAVFRFAGATAFVGYSLALWQNTIWFKRRWTTTLKSNIDGLLYGMLVGGAMGWLWPR